MAIVGGVMGLFVAALGIRFLTWLLANGEEDFTLHAGINGPILLFALLLSVIAGNCVRSRSRHSDNEGRCGSGVERFPDSSRSC